MSRRIGGSLFRSSLQVLCSRAVTLLVGAHLRSLALPWPTKFRRLSAASCLSQAGINGLLQRGPGPVRRAWVFEIAVEVL